MNKITLSILSLLARQPLSGYELKKQMNERISMFSKVSNNQIYPQITKLEEQGLIQLHEITSGKLNNTVKKIYSITQQGTKDLKNEILKESDKSDRFFSLVYNSWLIEEDFISEVKKEQEKHQIRFEIFNQKIEDLENLPQETYLNFSSQAILEYGLLYEKMYLEWCEKLIEKFSKIN